MQEPEQEPKPAPTPLIEVEANPSVAAGYAWLERALASDDGRKSPALEWLRARQRSAEPAKTGAPPPPERAPQTLAPIAEPAAEAAPEAPPAIEPELEATLEAAAPHEPASEPELKSEQEPSSEATAQIEHEEAATLEGASEPSAHDASAEQEALAQEPVVAAAPEHEPAPDPEAPASPAPTIIGRYSSGGSDFTLYSDGSIDAQTDQGMFHYGSMAELRAHIESLNAQA
jgi:hypothetical protein